MRASNLTFTELVRRLRLSQAGRMLQPGDATVSSISHAVGYANLSSFNLPFRREYGVTPSEFRARADDDPGPAEPRRASGTQALQHERRQLRSGLQPRGEGPALLVTPGARRGGGEELGEHLLGACWPEGPQQDLQGRCMVAHQQ